VRCRYTTANCLLTDPYFCERCSLRAAASTVEAWGGAWRHASAVAERSSTGARGGARARGGWRAGVRVCTSAWRDPTPVRGRVRGRDNYSRSMARGATALGGGAGPIQSAASGRGLSGPSRLAGAGGRGVHPNALGGGRTGVKTTVSDVVGKPCTISRL
jgi:hypothetical protein